MKFIPQCWTCEVTYTQNSTHSLRSSLGYAGPKTICKKENSINIFVIISIISLIVLAIIVTHEEYKRALYFCSSHFIFGVSVLLPFITSKHICTYIILDDYKYVCRDLLSRQISAITKLLNARSRSKMLCCNVTRFIFTSHYLQEILFIKLHQIGSLLLSTSLVSNREWSTLLLFI